MIELVPGDCVEVMAAMPERSVDAVVTDPPYALPGGFMGKAWDNYDGTIDAGACYYLAGLIDGEGCFRVQRHGRGSHTCTFSMQMRADDGAILHRARQLVGAGVVSEHAHNGGHPMVRWAVQDKDGCATLVGFLRRYPLRAKKALDFEVWAEAVGEWIDRPRGNRWHGRADQERAAMLKARVERAREFRAVPWSGHRFQDWTREWAEEAFRVLKPGGHLLAFGGTRTYHRLVCAVEDAGFEIRDTIMWLYGEGFPKSKNLPGGLGTALKPAHEPVVVARKPLIGSVAANVQEHGTGALNIDTARIRFNDGEVNFERRQRQQNSDGAIEGAFGAAALVGSEIPTYKPEGRWPANVVLDPEAAAMLDAQSGDRPGGNYPEQRSEAQATGFGRGQPTPGGARSMDDSGGASRFFYVAKAGARERNAGLDGFPETTTSYMTTHGGHADKGQTWRPVDERTGEVRERFQASKRNPHPTVKPVELMRWLVRLVTPPGGTVLDPFAGSGTTGIACALEGLAFCGVEREPEYIEIARARIAWWSRHRGEGDAAAVLDAAEAREAVASHGQLGLLDD